MTSRPARVMPAQRTSQLACGHWAQPGNRIAHADGRGWICLPCVFAILDLYSDCTRCRQPCLRYGPAGNPLCRDCRGITGRAVATYASTP